MTIPAEGDGAHVDGQQPEPAAGGFNSYDTGDVRAAKTDGVEMIALQDNALIGMTGSVSSPSNGALVSANVAEVQG